MQRRHFITGVVTALVGPEKKELFSPELLAAVDVAKQVVMTMQDMLDAVEHLRTSNVPPHPDGNYYYVYPNEEGYDAYLRWAEK